MTVNLSICFYDLPPAELLEAAACAEALGFDVCWLGEHLFLPSSYASVHPTRDEGDERSAPIVADRTQLVDPWVMAGAVGAVTHRIRFGTGIYLAALRHPLLSARAIATAHSLCRGRLVVGVGAGWLREEFDVLGIGFEDRGARLDEALTVLRTALAGGLFSHSGRYWSFGSVQVSPDPLPVPLVVGGNSPPALRRAARFGDGWYNSGACEPDDLLRARDRIEAERKKIARRNRPFTYWVRPPRLDADVSASLARQGFNNQVAWGEQLWPRDPGLTVEEKYEMMREKATELGLARAGTAAR